MMERLGIFKEWFLAKYGLDNEHSNIIVLPISTVAPDYRHVFPEFPPHYVPGLRTTYLSPILGSPELSIPGNIIFKLAELC